MLSVLTGRCRVTRENRQADADLTAESSKAWQLLDILAHDYYFSGN